MVSEVTDLDLIARLDAGEGTEVTDPELLAQLNAPPKRTGVTGVLSDIGSGVLEAPGLLYQGLKALPGEVYGAAKQVFEPSRLGKNVLAGAAQLGRGVLNIPSTTAQYLSDKELFPQGAAQAIPRMQPYDYAQALGIEGNQPGDALLRALPETPLWLAGGGPAAQALKFSTLGAIHEVNPATLAATEALGRVATKSLSKGAELASEAARLKSSLEKPLSGAVAEVEQAAKEAAIPTLAEDIAPQSGLAYQATDAASSMPFSKIKSFRSLQKNRAAEAAKSLASDLEESMIKSELSSRNGIEKIKEIAQGDSNRANAARNLLADFEEAGQDWNKIIKASGNSEALIRKYKADQLYDLVGELSSEAGENIVLDKTVNAIDSQLKDLRKAPSINKNEINFLESLKGDLFEGRDLSRLNFNDARKYRSFLMDKISDYYSGNNALVGKTGVSSLQEIKNALESDLSEFASKSSVPGLKEAWKNADSYYKENVIPFKDRALARALKAESNPDEIYKMFIKSGGEAGDFGTGRAVKFYNALDNQGRAAVRYGMVKQAVSKGFRENGDFSPAKFATALENLKASREVFFKGAEKKRLDGLAKVMRHIEKSSLAKPPETGVKTLPYIMLGLTGGAPGKVLSLVGASKALDWLVTSEQGKRYLINASELKPGSNAFTDYMNKIQSPLARYMNEIGVFEEEIND